MTERTKLITLRIPEELDYALNQIMARRRLTRTWLIVAILEHALETGVALESLELRPSGSDDDDARVHLDGAQSQPAYAS